MELIGIDQLEEYREFLSHELGEGGLAVEVGACSKHGSSTFLLVSEKNFSAILIEPVSPNQLRLEYAPYKDRIIIEPVAVGPESGVAMINIHSTPGHHSLRKDWIPETQTGQTHFVEVVKLEAILDYHNVPLNFDFLSVDTEGIDIEIVEDFLHSSQYRPNYIMVEIGGLPIRDWELLMNPHGYTKLYQSLVNLIFGRTVPL